MKNSELLSDITKWRLWGRWVFSTFGNAPWNYFSRGSHFKELNLPNDFTGSAVNIDGYVYALESDHGIFERFITDKIQNDISWFDAFFAACESNLAALGELRGKPDLRTLIRLYEDLACNSMIIHFCDKGLEPLIPELGLSAGLSSTDIVHLLVPHKPTIMMQYKSALRDIPDSKIDDLLKEYQWVSSNYLGGVRLTREDIIREKQHGEKEPEIVHFDISTLSERNRQQFLVIQKLIYYRSVNAETLNRSLNWHWEAFDALAAKYGLTRADLEQFAPYEIVDLMDTGNLPQGFDSRAIRNGMSCVDGDFTLYYGPALDEMLKVFEQRVDTKEKTVSGRIAFKGKVRGIVRIIQQIQDLQKISEGDIIIANETMPEYIVGMKKAAAFVTNQGGITSHAAIVAREMSKPCIIGTRVATKVFKDGDLVEVDAEKGVVSLLSNK
ncbi:MAG: hypothetical protein RIT04_499 [Candidatus Parcubacteria bacterium]|jgi:phosphohistidine swiveling domain-containing protein